VLGTRQFHGASHQVITDVVRSPLLFETMTCQGPLKELMELIAEKQREVWLERRDPAEVKAYWDAVRAELRIDDDDTCSDELEAALDLVNPFSDGTRTSRLRHLTVVVTNGRRQVLRSPKPPRHFRCEYIVEMTGQATSTGTGRVTVQQVSMAQAKMSKAASFRTRSSTTSPPSRIRHPESSHPVDTSKMHEYPRLLRWRGATTMRRREQLPNEQRSIIDRSSSPRSKRSIAQAGRR